MNQILFQVHWGSPNHEWGARLPHFTREQKTPGFLLKKCGTSIYDTQVAKIGVIGLEKDITRLLWRTLHTSLR